MSDWKTVSLSSLVENLDSQRVPVKQSERQTGQYPYYGASGIVDWVGGYLFEGEHLLVAEDGENLNSRSVPIAFRATGKFWVNNHAHILRGPSHLLRFLEHYLNNLDIAGWVTGSAQPKLTQGNLNSIPVNLPVDDDELKAIARVLGALDDKIELNRRMNRTLEELAAALFRSWFVDFDPVLAKAAGRKPAHLSPEIAALFPATFVESSLEAIPEGWSVCRLAELTSKIGSGSTPRGGSTVYVDDGPALIRSQNVHDHEFDWTGLARLTSESANALRSVEVQVGDVLLNITGDSILRTCVVDPDVLPAHVNQHVAIIRGTPEIPAHFLHLYLVQPMLKATMLGFDAGGTRPAITKGQLESVEIIRPSEPILDAFKKLTDPLFAMSDANRRESRTLAALRDTLLPKLLSGELRVKAAEKLVEANA